MIIRIDTEKPYDVIVENGALDRAGSILKPLFKAGSKALIVTDSHVFPFYGERLTKSLMAAGFQVSGFMFDAGEEQKQLSTVADLYEALAEKSFAQTDVIVTLGGGVAGDLGGFAAATYLGGIDYVQVPTSLMAQVDASVGGRTAVNLPFGKNLIGAAYSPRTVICDPETLSTLPDEFFLDGMGEVIKYGCVMDAELFGQLERGEVIDRMEETVARCVECKKQLMYAENEEKRTFLDFGHTFGQALEKLADGDVLTHGLAVGIGMVMACTVGESFGVTVSGTAERLRAVLENYGLPAETKLDFSKVVEATALDKMHTGKTLNLVLLKDIGSCVIHPIDRSYLVLRYKIAAEQMRRKK